MNKMSAILASLLIGACSSTPKVETPQAAVQPSKPAVATNAPTTGTVATAETSSVNLAAEVQQLQKQSVYFDFDQSSVKPEYRDVVQKQADFIKAHRGDVVTVAGNADERGSNEYNLALGDRRAQTVKKSLELLGVGAAQINTVSYGKEKPRLLCHAESCWHENRRADFAHKLN